MMTRLVRQSAGGVQWHVLPEWLPILLGPEGLRLDQWRGEGRVTVVKDASHRAVYRVDLPGRSFYVKHYRCPRFWDTARHLVRICSAQREWRKVTEVARRGIATVRPVAWGQRVRFGLARDNYFVTEALRGTCTLQHYVDQVLPQLMPRARTAMRRRLGDRLARLMAATHRAGVLHNDFHAGNVLVEQDCCLSDVPEDDASPQLYLIDLANVRLTAPLDWTTSRENLAVLSSAWWESTSLGQRWRFWRTYLACRPDLDLPDRRLAAAWVDRRGREVCRQVHRRRDKRSLQANRDFTAIRGAGGEVHGIGELLREALIRWLQDPEDLVRRNLDRPVKLGHSSIMVQAELPLATGTCRVALKRYCPRNWWRAVRGVLRSSRARRGWYAGHALLQRRIATPRPIALCEPRRWRPGQPSYLATEWIEGAENLHLWGWQLAGLPLGLRLRRAARCARSVGRLVGRMHAFQIAHRDLKGSNLLIVDEEMRTDALLIDVDSVRVMRRLSRRLQVADLARLALSIEAHPWVTRSVFCRFLRAYAAQFPRGEIVWKDLWRYVAMRVDRLAANKRRRGQQVL
jgi:tRNA A-37 threonylcarbamoyl transferase component Bud32